MSCFKDSCERIGMILTKKETNTPIRVSSMRFKAKPEILVSVPCVTVTLRKAMQVMFVNAFLRMKSTRYLKGASAKGCFSSCLGLVILKWGGFLTISARNMSGMMQNEINKYANAI